MKWNIPLLDWQLEGLNSQAEVKAFSGASDTGKSWICRLGLVKSCLQYPHSHHFATSSTYTQAYRAIIEPMVQDLNRWGYGDRVKYKHQEKYLQFWNGSRVEVYGAEKLFDKIKSREFFSGFLEEATTINDKYIETFFAEANRRLRQPGFENVNKPLYLATNPDIKTRWLYENVFDNPTPDMFVKQMGFKQGFHRNDKEREKKILMGSKRQIDLYYYGLWGNLEGVAFLLDEGVHIQPFDSTELDQFYIAFDYGFSPDPMVYLLCSVKNGIIFIVDEVILPAVETNRHEAYIKPWFDKYNIIGFTGDTSAGSADIRDLLLSLGILYHPTTKVRSLGWVTLADLIDLRKFVVHPRCKLTIKSLGSMIWVGSTIGVDCDGDFDDPADAVRYFMMCRLIFDKLGLKKVRPGKITLR